VPRLREVQAEAAARIDQPEAYMRLSRLFHTQLVALCGNVTMIVTVGALEALWAAQVEELAFRGDDLGSFGDPGVRRTSNREHQALLRHIEHGRTRPAEDAARRHFSERWQYPFDSDQVVVAARLRRLSGRRTTSTTS
jgi:DNA-binding GntR family transcriptional regulator